MIVRVTNKLAKGSMNFGTHNGIFHVDEVVAIAILEIANFNVDVTVVRTRDLEELAKAAVVVDIGGGELDHHIRGFDKRRITGEKYASAGLTWKKFGTYAVRSIMMDAGLDTISSLQIDKVVQEIDKEIMIPVDQEDNGEAQKDHLFSFVQDFLPAWTEEVPDYDEAFADAVYHVSDILQKRIRRKLLKLATKNELKSRFAVSESGILEIPNQRMDWVEEVTSYNKTCKSGWNFVIFPYPAGGWAAQAVPPSMENRFSQRVPFPKEWAGADALLLAELSGVEDATLCNGTFFIRARTKEAVIKLCRIAENHWTGKN